MQAADVPGALDRVERATAGADVGAGRGALANCGNWSGGSTSLVAVKVPASSSGLSATAGPPNVAAGAGQRAGPGEAGGGVGTSPRVAPR